MEPRLIDPEFLRARIAGLHHLREQYTLQLREAGPVERAMLERDIAILRNGVYPDDVDADSVELMLMKDRDFSDAPLTTTELMTFNTYFELYPWKIGGYQTISSSRDFPVTVQGTRADVETAIDHTLNHTPDLEAEALEIERNLFSL